MTITFDRAINGVITIDDGDVSVDYPKPDLRLHFSEKNGDCRIYYGRDIVHVFRISDEIVINGDPFSGNMVALQQTLRSEIFFLAESGGGSMTPGQIVDSLESLDGDQRLDASAVKNISAGGGGVGFSPVATYAAIGASTVSRFILVAADESQSDSPRALYLHDGTTLNFIANLFP